MRYGFPLKGSKNGIANAVVDFLPESDTLVDLFCGGCSITHCAITRRKYRHYIINDIDAWKPQLFMDSIAGKYHGEKRWISREDFFALKDEEPYIKTCWSFGNDCETYLYGKWYEPWKKALWYARVFHDTGLFKDMGIITDGSAKDIKTNEEKYKGIYRDWYMKNYGQSLSALESLQRLQSLSGNETLITAHHGSYDELGLPPKEKCVIYCDIPYRGTDAPYVKGFNFDRFYRWATDKSAEGYRIYISEYDMPREMFRPVWMVQKNILSDQFGAHRKANEYIFVPINQKDTDENRQYEQMSLF